MNTYKSMPIYQVGETVYHPDYGLVHICKIVDPPSRIYAVRSQPPTSPDEWRIVFGSSLFSSQKSYEEQCEEKTSDTTAESPGSSESTPESPVA